jgi:hypothetical protein
MIAILLLDIQTNKFIAIPKTDCESLSTSPLFACCWMSFEAVLSNKEFEFVVSEVTLTVITRCSTSGVLGQIGIWSLWHLSK